MIFLSHPLDGEFSQHSYPCATLGITDLFTHSSFYPSHILSMTGFWHILMLTMRKADHRPTLPYVPQLQIALGAGYTEYFTPCLFCSVFKFHQGAKLRVLVGSPEATGEDTWSQVKEHGVSFNLFMNFCIFPLLFSPILLCLWPNIALIYLFSLLRFPLIVNSL